MNVAIVAALARNRVIGRDNALPWRLPRDLRRFRELTLGKPVVMGRRTFESIGKPLPGRRNIVITRHADLGTDGVDLAPSPDAALDLVAGAPEVMVIGGASIYQALLARASRLYLTLVEAALEGDRHFPELAPGAWRELERLAFAADAENPHPMTFVTLEAALGGTLEVAPS